MGEAFLQDFKDNIHTLTLLAGFTVELPAKDTTPDMRNLPESPFHYDYTTKQLWIELPMSKHKVIGKLK